MNWIVEIDDEEGGKGRKIYISPWITTAHKEWAKKFKRKEAKKQKSMYLKANKGATARVIKN